MSSPSLSSCVSTPCGEKRSKYDIVKLFLSSLKPNKLFSWAAVFLDNFYNILSNYSQPSRILMMVMGVVGSYGSKALYELLILLLRQSTWRKQLTEERVTFWFPVCGKRPLWWRSHGNRKWIAGNIASSVRKQRDERTCTPVSSSSFSPSPLPMKCFHPQLVWVFSR